ncbi:MAG: hypothetical protein JWO80_1402 [Bryobacterales bacterium]|nr:hypothetical protein [Bryobacterales bacterium]
MDEKTAIQGLTDSPRNAFLPGRVERHGFEYRRNGTFSLYSLWGENCQGKAECYTGAGNQAEKSGLDREVVVALLVG